MQQIASFESSLRFGSLVARDSAVWRLTSYERWQPPSLKLCNPNQSIDILKCIEPLTLDLDKRQLA